MKVVVKEMDNTIADLVSNAGDDSLRDRQRRGMIEGLKWLTEWVPTVEDTDVNIDSEEDDNAITSTGSSGSY